tara:strand:- start:210 stop:701 length:492 start_codon:yes stop_codon:yes gene_type:complete
MAVIKPSFTLVANKNSSSTNPGPLSVALSLSASDLLTVDNVRSEIITFTSDTNHKDILVGANYSTADGAGGASGVGGYVWLKNTTSSGTDKIYIGFGSDADVAQDLSGADQMDDFDNDTANQIRFMTLERGEFAWFPWDYTTRITGDASAANQTLEYWVFDRG